MNNPFKGKYGPLLIAEIGGNHEGNFEYAMKLVDLAISTNVDFVKFQLYTGDTLVSRIESPVRNSHFKKFQLTKEQHIAIAEKIIKAGIGYMASVWDEEMMLWIDKYMPIYKIGSGDLTAYSVLKTIAKKGKPIILSTGLSTENEVLEAVKYIQSIDKKYLKPENLALLQCTSMYPINHSDANLNVMSKLKELTGLTIGYSDHTIGWKTLAYSVAMGAEILEFHFTDSREGKEFRDHKVSLIPEEVIELENEIQFIQSIKGNETKKPLQIEEENGHVQSFRRAVYPKFDLKAGTVLSEENLICLRPNSGIDARDFEKLIGKTTTIDLLAHQKLDWKNIK
ncbi:MAG TPA: N-acetylneuraminate synthase [Bacteroidales bacterium]|nr:MAG: N-acetylneuraminate synthase [Bacteroidetes bacterium GWF2_33_38]OFY71499.1 MAG: N-acetylneuraminate synthase [Bacteroidetes bacterium RIFOXYA12_FULL_33_9]OFY90762.1 MAG: N-acetylneuraminate synthase [Bacteroidetes bacterium RIFOXYA2_FULL_33_7]HBF87724.1 N-acetylneuraminate synthase [Bacteroidales bacterium]